MQQTDKSEMPVLGDSNITLLTDLYLQASSHPHTNIKLKLKYPQ